MKIRMQLIKSGSNVTTRKFNRLFIFMLLLPVICVSALYYYFSIHVLDIEVEDITLRSLTYAKKNIETRFEAVSEISQSILSASFPFLNRAIELDSLSQQIDDISSLNSIVSSYEKRNMIHKIQLFVDNHKIYANQRDRFYPISSISNDDIEYFKQSFDLGKNVIWKAPERVIFNDGLGNRNYDAVIQCLSLLKYTGNYDQFSGILCINILEEELSDLLDTGLNYNEVAFLVNDEGVVLSHPDKSMIGIQLFSKEEMDSFSEKGAGVYNGNSEYGKEMVAFAHMSFPSWTLLVRIPRKTLHERSLHFFYTGGFVTFLVFLLIIIITAYYIYKIMLRDNIQRFSNIVYRLGHEAYGLLPEKGADNQPDLSTLENHVEQLVDVFRTTMEREYKSKIIQRDAQLHALQTQINPHFLYNTLDLIKWKILDSEKETGINLINSLSKYFRLSLNKGKDIVPLKEEIDLIRAYLDIQLMRFDGRFKVDFDLDSSLNEIKIPKMTLQPFVENALVHGLYNRLDNKGIIRITAKKAIANSSDVLITIYDNGCGMSEEKIKEVLSASSGAGYGIHNVDQRLKLLYGDNYGISIASSEGKGTEISILIKSS